MSARSTHRGEVIGYGFWFAKVDRKKGDQLARITILTTLIPTQVEIGLGEREA